VCTHLLAQLRDLNEQVAQAATDVVYGDGMSRRWVFEKLPLQVQAGSA